MSINESDQILYNMAKEKANEIIKLLEKIKCGQCEDCPLYKSYSCSKYDLIGYLDNEFN